MQPSGEPTNQGPRNRSQGDRDSASIPDSAEGGTGGGASFARMMQQAGPYIAASSTLTGALIVGALGGRWLDGRLGTAPWLTLLGVLLGAGLGLYQLARVALARGGRT